MTDKLKPCPFCGGTAKELAEGDVSCFNHDCPMSAMSMTADAWNNRAPDPLVAGLVSALREIEAGNLDEETFVQFHNRVRQVARKAIARYGEMKGTGK